MKNLYQFQLLVFYPYEYVLQDYLISQYHFDF
mgnify:CR=1 FL=1